MRTATLRFRRLLAAIAPALAVLVLAAGLVSALHHHPNDRAHDQCAVCSFGATPAVTAAGSPQPGAPAFAIARLSAPVTRAPGARIVAPALSRGPPSA
jgi:hypothetical protein